MSTGLLQQLADYGAFHDEEQGYIDVDDVFATGDLVFPSDTPLQPARRRGNRTGVWVAIAAAVLTILLIGVIPWLLGDQGAPPADTAVTTTLVNPTPTTVAEFTPTTPAESTPTTVVGSPPTTLGELVLVPGSWSRIPHDESVFGGDGDQSMSSVTVGGPGLVAVGGDGLHDSGHAAIWTSVDGIEWSRVPHDEEVFGGPGEQWMGTVTVGGPGLVAVGWALENPWDADAAVWTSPDGINWTRVPHDEAIFGGLSYQAMGGVTAGGPGLVAVGEDRSRDVDDGDVAVWTSVDGITWSRVPHDESVFGTGQVTSVTSTDSRIVAVGNEGFDGGDHAAVWTSPNGIDWSRVPHDDNVFGRAVMQSVTVGGPGFVAVGSAGSGDGIDAAVWTSADGINWSRVPHDEDIFGGVAGQAMESVTVGGPGLVAGGWDVGAAAVWTSPDGITWSRVSEDQAIFASGKISSVASANSALVAVGNDWSDNYDAAVWVMPLDD